jgi:hypothetical protein
MKDIGVIFRSDYSSKQDVGTGNSRGCHMGKSGVGSSHEKLVLIPAMALLFMAGRLTFWIGYLMRPVARAFGMILTAPPTVGSIPWLLAHWASS